MTPAQQLLAKINEKRTEATRLYRILGLWAEVQAQGHDPDDVESFGYDEKLLTPALKRERDRIFRITQVDPHVERMPNGSHRLRIFNYVRMKTGERKTLYPVVEAVH